MDLRDYQQQTKTELRNAFLQGLRRLLMVVPTGGGKTVIFTNMVSEMIAKGKTCMILCDRKELIKQAYSKITQYDIHPTIIAPGYKLYKNSVYLASVDTLKRYQSPTSKASDFLRRELPYVDCIIVDEAHKQTFDKILLEYIELCNPFIIGATATPLRTGSQNCLSLIYQDIVNPVSVQNLLDLNFLAPARTFASKLDMSSVKVKGGDYDNKAMYEKFNSVALYDGVVENYLKFSDGKKAICFNVNVEHSVNMVQKFRDSGLQAVHLDGNTPDAERTKILRDYSKENFILSNCSVLTTGFDEPSIEVVIVNRATLSLPLWLQMTGRGSRIYKKKEHFTIIDQGANVYRHGMWEDDREWSLYKKPKRKGDGVAPVKVCGACEALNASSTRLCKVCGQQFEVKEKKLAQAEFVEIKKNRGLGVKFDVRNATNQELADYAKEMGYKKGWVYQQMKLNGKI